MHLLLLLPLPFLLTTLTTAQSLANIPQCASGPALQSFTSTGCQLTDIPCICRNEAFLASLLPVVREACSPDELAQVTAFAQDLCRDNGVTLDIPTTTTTSSAAGGEEPTTMATAPSGTGTGTNRTGGAGGNNGTVASTGMPSPTQVVQQPGSGAGAVGASLGAVLLLGGAVAVGGGLL